MTNSKKNIAIIAGGNQSEAIVSYKSAANLSEMLDHSKYSIFIISIVGKEWIGKGTDIEGINIDKNDFSLTVKGKKILFDCAFIAIHGSPGENGILSAYFEMIGIPHTTCGVYSSALSFNKYATKIFLKEFGIESAKTIKINKKTQLNPDSIIQQLGLPCFVKPNQAGSSFGVTMVKKKEDLYAAIEEGFKEDTEVLIEEYIKGTEITCGILKTNSQELIFPITEIVSKKEFFDYEAKYTTGLSEEITPARIPESLANECKALTSKIYDLLNCRGIIRVDFIYSNNKLYLLEPNTVPGMSKNSIIPQQIRAIGLNPMDIFGMVIENAINGTL